MKRLLKLVISLALLVGLVWWAGLPQLVNALKQANLWLVLPGVGLYLFGQWISAIRWQWLAEVLGFNAARSTYVDGYLLGMVCSLFLPSAIGGDAVRTLLLARQCGKRKREAVLTLLAERGVGLVILLWLTAIACCFPAVQTLLPWPVLWGIWGGSVGLLMGWAALLFLPVQQLAQRWPMLSLLAQAEPYWRHPQIIVPSLGISLVVQGIMVVVHIGMGIGLGIFPEPANVGLVIAAYGLATLAGVVPLAFAGFGLREGTYQWVFGLAGVPMAQGLAYGVYWALIMLATTAAAGAWLVWRRPDLWQWLKHRSESSENADAAEDMGNPAQSAV